MRIVIVGAGTVGVNLASKLSQEGHDLFLIDSNINQLRAAEESLDVKTIKGDATSVVVQKSAQIQDADLLIAVTSNDAVNILTCQLGSKLGAKKNIARIRDSAIFDDPTVLTPFDLGIDQVIYPEGEAAKEILKLVFRPYASEVSTFFGDQMELVSTIIQENSRLIGKTQEEIKELSEKEFSLVALVREEECMISKNWEGAFLPGDKIYLVSRAENMAEVVSALGFEFKKMDNIFIYGGTTVGLNLAKKLEASKVQARILEPNRETSRKLAYDLRKVLVLHGEGTDSSLLDDEGIEDADVFVAVTADEESNLLSCILAKQMGAKKSIALITKKDYLPLISELDVDSVISTRMLTINRILQFVRRGEVISVSELSEEKLEAIEFRITHNTVLTAMEMGSEEFQNIFPPGAMIGGIQLESGEARLPSPEYELQVGDRVMVYASQEAIAELEKLFV